MSRGWSGGGGVLVFYRPATHLLCSRTVRCAHRLFRDSEAIAESGTKHGATLSVGHGAGRKPVCTLPRVGQERSVLMDLPRTRGALNDTRHLPDRKD